MKRIELLAPGGDVDSIKAAIVAGADAVYCGLNKFNARNRAANITYDKLHGILHLAHQHNCQVFLTLNILILESEIPDLIRVLNKLINTSIDGIIVQDLGLFYLISKYFKSLKIHASTQLTTHNDGQIKFLSKLNATRANLSRELNINEIKALTVVGQNHKLDTEVFVHGSYCISFSGLCYMSSALSGKSGNRGQCSQQCRDRYITTEAGKDYPLNMKDNSAYFNVQEIIDAGVSSIKIEGRIKEFEYVYTIVKAWKKQLDGYYINDELQKDNSDLYRVFNRDFSNSYLKGNISKEMFIDNPMSHSINHLSGTQKTLSEYNEEKQKLSTLVKSEIDALSIEKIPLSVEVSGKHSSPLKVSVKTPDTSFDIFSEINLSLEGTEVLDKRMVLKKLKAINDTEYYIENISFDNLHTNLYINFKEFTSIKNRLLFFLNNSREYVKPVKLPVPGERNSSKITPSLSVLISSGNDLGICNDNQAQIYFSLPEGFRNSYSDLIDLFKENRDLVPWFPPILIGEDFFAAVKFLKEIQAEHIVTNNTGIAYEAWKMGIPWIAGPFMNIVNSYSLMNLKENFSCSGAFLSNEIKQYQIKSIRRPDDFKLYYSIYHPIPLMTSRQCLFHQVSGCEKSRIDGTCIRDCEKEARITDLDDRSFHIEKSPGNYHRIYHERNYLNTDIVTELPDIFSGFFVDLRDIETGTRILADKSGLVNLFERHINGDHSAKEGINRVVQNSTMDQYIRGI